MFKKAAIACAIAAAGIVTVVTQQNTTATPDLSHYAPADTPVFFSSVQPDLFNGFSVIDPDAHMASWLPLFEQAEQGGLFLQALLNDFYHAAANSETGLMQHYGIQADGQAVLYLEGMTPVMRVQLADSSALWQALDKAEQTSGLAHQPLTQSALEGRRYTLYQQPAESAQVSFQLKDPQGNIISDDQTTLTDTETPRPTLDLVIAVKDNHAVLTLVGSHYAEQALERVLANEPPAEKLVDQAHFKEMLTTYQFEANNAGFIDLLTIVQSLTQPDSHRLGRELAAHLPDSQTILKTLQTPECAADYTTLISGAPRIVSGNHYPKATDADQRIKGDMIWEIRNADVNQQLRQLDGHIPAHVLNANQALLSIGLGLDVDQLAPTLTALWQQLNAQSFQCAQLQQLQAVSQQLNPMMLGGMVGMLQGLKGAGFSLYDAQLDMVDEALTLTKLDAIFSIASSNPDILLMLLKQLPFLPPELVDLHRDNPVEFTLPTRELPFTFTASVNNGGIAVTLGEQATQALTEMDSTPLTHNGIMAMSFKHQLLNDSATHLQPVLTPLLSQDPEACADMESAFLDMQSNPMDMLMHFSTTEQGIKTHVTLQYGTVDKNQAPVKFCS